MTGLRINTAHTMMVCWNNFAGRKGPEKASKFVYRGGTVTQEGGSDEDIKSRLEKARTAFSKLRNIWKSCQLKLKTKLKMFKSNVAAVLLYGCETWRMIKRDATKLEEFLHKSLRRLMKIYWPMKISNEEIRNRANISTIIFRWCWKFIGHMLRINPNKHPKTTLTWDPRPEGRRSRGRLGAEPQRKKEQYWVLSQGARQQWLLVTVRHGQGEYPAQCPLRVMVINQVSQ